MSSEHAFEEKGKAKPRPEQQPSEPLKKPEISPPGKIQNKVDRHTLTQMQHTVGNSAVQRFLAQRSESIQRSGSGPTELDDDTAAAIHSQRGSGQSLDGHISDKAGSVMGQDFGGVKIHTDSQADHLSQQLGAKAFTTGNDIFFREGAYEPGSGEGQRLISHELTHVVQQGASTPSVQGKLTVNDPNDQYEAEADRVADTVMSKGEDVAAQRQEEEEEIQMQEEEEEEIQMQELEEEEEVQMKRKT
jgi:hypothetical protein